MKTTFTHAGNPCLVLNYGKQALLTKEIKYIVGDGNYSSITTKTQGVLLSSFTLRLFSDSLGSFQNFFSPRKGLLINIDYLENVFQKDGVYYAKMKDGNQHILSRRKGRAFVEYLLSNELDNLVYTIK